MLSVELKFLFYYFVKLSKGKTLPFLHLLPYFCSLTLSIFQKQLIVLSDLECDYLNAQQCCSRLNAVGKKAIDIFINFSIYFSSFSFLPTIWFFLDFFVFLVFKVLKVFEIKI